MFTKFQVVLSACSSYFEKLLIQNPCQHPIIFMKDLKHWQVQALVDFMYKGEVNIDQEHLNSLLLAAESLQVKIFEKFYLIYSYNIIIFFITILLSSEYQRAAPEF